MSEITVQWHDENQQIILFTFDETIDWDIYANAVDRLLALADTVEHPVVEIMDLTAIKGLPENTLVEGRRAMSRDPHPNIIAIVIVGMNPYLNAMLKMFQRILPKRMMDQWNLDFADTMDDALIVAQQHLSQN